MPAKGHVRMKAVDTTCSSRVRTRLTPEVRSACSITVDVLLLSAGLTTQTSRLRLLRRNELPSLPLCAREAVSGCEAKQLCSSVTVCARHWEYCAPAGPPPLLFCVPLCQEDAHGRTCPSVVML
jgi:hypothetical protein